MTQDLTEITVRGHRIGILGLPEVFSEVSALNLTEVGDIKNEIVKRVRKNNYVPAEANESYKEALYMEFRRYRGEEVESEQGILEIRILGPGCPRCEELMRRVMAVAAEMDLPADIQHVRDLKTIAGFGLVPTPGLVVNGQVKTAGKVPSREELKKLLS
jgi:small redox-active disulfide protein 2